MKTSELTQYLNSDFLKYFIKLYHFVNLPTHKGTLNLSLNF